MLCGLQLERTFDFCRQSPRFLGPNVEWPDLWYKGQNAPGPRDPDWYKNTSRTVIKGGGISSQARLVGVDLEDEASWISFHNQGFLASISRVFGIHLRDTDPERLDVYDFIRIIAFAMERRAALGNRSEPTTLSSEYWYIEYETQMHFWHRAQRSLARRKRLQHLMAYRIKKTRYYCLPDSCEI